MMMLSKGFVALYSASIDTDHHRTAIRKLCKAIPKGAGFLGAYTAFIFWIEVDDQLLLAQIVFDGEVDIMLIPQYEKRYRFSDLRTFILAHDINFIVE
jgi:hypothetical protein